MLAGRFVAAALSIVAGSAALAAGSSPTPTAISLGTSPYTQNFDTLTATGTSSYTALPTGWQITENGTGAAADGRYIVGTGSNNAGGAYSFGAAGSSDRALGSLTSGTVNPIYFGAFFTNDTGATITGLSLDYTGELWRRGSNSGDALNFSYYVGTPTSLSSTGWVNFDALDFVSPGTGSGAVDGNTVSTDIAAIISGLSISAGSSFAIRWTDSTISPGTNDGMAIDDLSLTAITASAVPETGTWAMMVAGFGLLGGAMRRRRVTAFA
ncbi:PEPxxWA-CTERM sorting domain-containing protein [Sphingomonas sp. AP4-R1]|nr:PEPxxWA-CTERM sorting domain-containing protein [Sphingomonas sp. AP4-R1]